MAFGVCRRLVGGEAPAQQQCSTSTTGLVLGCTSMHFGENQLSPRSIGISPLATGHPSPLQRTPVRPSTACYGRFSLPMASSRGFGSTRCDTRAVHTRFRCGSAYHWLNQPHRVTRRIMLQKARRQRGHAPLRLRLHGSQRVQGLFHSPRRGTFHRSLTVLCAIGHVVYGALGRGRPRFTPPCPWRVLLKYTYAGAARGSPTGLSPALVRCSKPLRLHAPLTRGHNAGGPCTDLQPPRRNACTLGTARV